jgi:RecB family exonuclease
VAGHARALWRVLRSVGATSVLEVPAPRDLAVANPLAMESAEARLGLERLAELLGELTNLKVAGAELPELDRAEFASLLRDLMSREPAPEPLAAGGGVALTEFSDLIGRRVDHLFLVELGQDGQSLAAVQEELFLPAALRRELRRMLERPALFGGTGRQEKLAEEALLFTLAASSARRSLTASAPRSDAKDRPLDASPSLAELARAAGVAISAIGGGPLPLGGRCLTRREVAAAHPDSPAVQRAEPERAEEIHRLRREAAERDAAIAAGRSHPFSGGLSSSARAMLREALAFPPSKPASPSLIGQLGACGFRGLWEVLLRVQPPIERSEELDAREQGTLRHRCLEEVYRLLMARELVPLVGGARREVELRTVLEGIEIGLEHFAREEPVGHPVVFAAQQRRLRREIVGLYQADVDEGADFKPMAFELGFKAGEVEPVELEGLPDGPASLGGRIDRLDESRAKDLRVVEYKRGRLQDYQTKLREGLTTSRLQLPIYAALVSVRYGKGRTVDAKYASFVDGEVRREGVRKICEDQGIDPDSFLSNDPEVRARCRAEKKPNVFERATELLAAARSGALPVQPGDCRGCTLVAACRVGPRYLEWDT